MEVRLETAEDALDYKVVQTGLALPSRGRRWKLIAVAFVVSCLSFIVGNFFVSKTNGRLLCPDRTVRIINTQHDAANAGSHADSQVNKITTVKPAASHSAHPVPAIEAEAKPYTESSPAGPRMPYEDIGACPFEGCTYRCWTANKDTVIWSDRTAKSPVAFTIQKGEQVIGVTGTVVTSKAGRARAIKNMDLAGLRARAGQTIFLLTYLGEGHYKAWFGGKIIDGVDITEFKLVEKPRFTWWVLIQEKNGQSGWTSKAENFDHKDRFE